METDNVEEVSDITNPTPNNEIQTNEMIDSTHDCENENDLTNDEQPDDIIRSCEENTFHNEHGDDANDTVDVIQNGNFVMELTQYNDEGASFSTLDISNLDRSELDLSVRKDLNFVFDNTVEGEEEGAAVEKNDFIDPQASDASTALDDGDNDDSSRLKAHLTKPFEDLDTSASTPAVRYSGNKDVAISDAYEDDEDDDPGDDDDGDETREEEGDDDEEAIDDKVHISVNDDTLHDRSVPRHIPSFPSPDAPVTTPSNDEANRSERTANPEPANLSFLHLDVTGADETFNDTSTVFQSDNGEISFILHDGSFIAADGLIFGEVGEEEDPNDGVPPQSAVGALSIDQRLQMVESDLPTARRASEEVANEESGAEGHSTRDAHEAADNQANDTTLDASIQQGALSEGFDANGGELVYLQDGEGRLIQVWGMGFFDVLDSLSCPD